MRLAAATTGRRATETIQRLSPGVLACLTVAMAATFVSDHYGGPTLVFALLLGMALHFLSKETAAAAGIAFSARTILRVGVALLGAVEEIYAELESEWAGFLDAGSIEVLRADLTTLLERTHGGRLPMITPP